MNPIYEWVDDSHFLHFHHRADPRQLTDGFGDSVHHTGYWLTATILNKSNEYACSLYLRPGILQRMEVDAFRRHPRVEGHTKYWNRDQLTSIIFPMQECGLGNEAKLALNKHSGILWPQQWMHFQRSLNIKHFYLVRLFTDVFECIDSITDWFSESESSYVKNVHRLVIANIRYPTFLTGLASWLLKLDREPNEVMELYFSRAFEARDTPPPIHIPWKRLVDKYL